MPDLASMLLRRSLGSPSIDPTCDACHRTPLPGERLHEMRSGRTLCDLCRAALPEDKRQAVRSERVHASARHLAVVPKAA
jgi:CRISPR/Cas system-associated protein Cas10 (large subunit of type III CRISPR-Cas system)